MTLTDKLGHTIDELQENWTDLMWWRHRIGNRVIGPVHLNIHPKRRGSTYVTEADWDVLVVLDGCRVDLFESIVDTDRFDSYQTVKSPGSKTPEWAVQNFGGKQFGDTVYIASNGQVSKALEPTFHRLVDVWQETDGVPYPIDITEAAIAAKEDYPDKRLIIHYLQPHRPFITSENRFSQGFTDNPWQSLGNGNAERDDVWKLYKENLEVVFDEAFELARELPGRAIMTSDHGNLLGERSWPLPILLYGHPGGVRHPDLVNVPWGVIEAEERPEISHGEIQAGDKISSEGVEEHLSDLGYL